MNDALNANSTKNSWLSITWRTFSILLWLVIALSFAIFFLLDLQLDYTQIKEACGGPDCNWVAISSAEETVLKSWGLSTNFYAWWMVVITLITVLIFWSIGALIFWLQGLTRIGWTVSLSLFVIPINMIADPDNVIINYPGLTTQIIILSLIGEIIYVSFFLLFPNGRFVPRWSVIWLIFFILIEPVLQLTFAGILILNISQPVFWGVVIVMFITQIVAIISFQLYRYFRVSTPGERLQTKWVLFGFVVLLLGFPVWLVLYSGIVTIPPGAPRLLASSIGWLLITVMTVTLPITIAIAIMRYELWNINRIIRGSLIYALLTGILLLLFFSSVIVLQTLSTSLLGDRQSQLSIVGSTLLVAALLNPLRGRIQSLIDRRFFRQKYDAQQALSRFSATLNSEVADSEGIAALLLEVLDETIQPDGAALWLREKNQP